MELEGKRITNTREGGVSYLPLGSPSAPPDLLGVRRLTFRRMGWRVGAAMASVSIWDWSARASVGASEEGERAVQLGCLFPQLLPWGSRQTGPWAPQLWGPAPVPWPLTVAGPGELHPPCNLPTWGPHV